mmetsp:Transcript_6002/g.13243  ORF Transcript_6002/g.13243 Transcript_6002/m.13243 type:complete len:267 (-) Transcript_6002:195-995(-)
MACGQFAVPPTIVKNTFIEIAVPEDGSHGGRRKVRRGRSTSVVERSSFHKRRDWADMLHDEEEGEVIGDVAMNTRSEGGGSESSCSMLGPNVPAPSCGATQRSEDSDDTSDLSDLHDIPVPAPGAAGLPVPLAVGHLHQFPMHPMHFHHSMAVPSAPAVFRPEVPKNTPLDAGKVRLATLTAKAAAEAHRTFLQDNPAALDMLFVGDFALWSGLSVMMQDQEYQEQMWEEMGSETFCGGEWQCPQCGAPKYHAQVNFCAFCGTRLS